MRRARIATVAVAIIGIAAVLVVPAMSLGLGAAAGTVLAGAVALSPTIAAPSRM